MSPLTFRRVRRSSWSRRRTSRGSSAASNMRSLRPAWRALTEATSCLRPKCSPASAADDPTWTSCFTLARPKTLRRLRLGGGPTGLRWGWNSAERIAGSNIFLLAGISHSKCCPRRSGSPLPLCAPPSAAWPCSSPQAAPATRTPRPTPRRPSPPGKMAGVAAGRPSTSEDVCRSRKPHLEVQWAHRRPR
jgi:hypothetical protein